LGQKMPPSPGSLQTGAWFLCSGKNATKSQVRVFPVRCANSGRREVKRLRNWAMATTLYLPRPCSITRSICMYLFVYILRYVYMYALTNRLHQANINSKKKVCISPTFRRSDKLGKAFSYMPIIQTHNRHIWKGLNSGANPTTFEFTTTSALQ
jgi:hypothetical protein